MSAKAHIAAHRAHKFKVNLLDCEDCTMATEEAPTRLEHPTPPTMPEGTPLPGEELGEIETPSQTPQKPRTEPPTITPLGTLIYTRTHWEPPPAPPGWHREDSDPEVWKLVPDRAICQHLTLVPAEIGACGYHRVSRHCGLVDSFIGPTTCQRCEKGAAVDGSW